MITLFYAVNILKEKKIFFTALFAAISIAAVSQQTTIIDTTSDPRYPTVIAGSQYKAGKLHHLFWGKHYRTEWTTPVKVKSVFLDTLEGGIKPILKGGGRQTRTLRLADKDGKQFVLRSIDKTFGRALPEIFRGTFSEKIINDQVSIAHPYAFLTVPVLAEAAKIFHTNPRVVFIPSQKALGEFNNEFANQLYLFEERPGGNQEETENFGNPEDIDGTEKLLQKLREENDHLVDQKAYIRARLFDMFVSDWGRHEDQWRWANFKEDDVKIYRPIPRDRDQVYTLFDGFLVGQGVKREEVGYLQSFDFTIKNIEKYNYQARHLDRLLANEPGKETWMTIANDLQQSLTNSVIERAVKQLPPEIYPISGDKIVAKLKSRRNNIVKFASDYYASLAKEVEVVGTKKSEVFEITGNGGKEIKVEAFDKDSEGNKKSKPFYSRTFVAGETNEIRVYGYNGDDQFKVTGDVGRDTKIRLIGGPKKDEFTVKTTAGSEEVKIYDDSNNTFQKEENVNLHLSSDTNIHQYNYTGFRYDSKLLKPGLSYSNEDRLFVSLGYHHIKRAWRKSPYAFQQDIRLNYSITQKSFSARYKADFTELIGKWNLNLLASIDEVIDVYFAGIGNNTLINAGPKPFYRFRTRELHGGIGLERQLNKSNHLGFTAFYQLIKVLKDGGKFIEVGRPPGFFSLDQYAGISADYKYDHVDHKLFPTKGISFVSSASFTQNLKETAKSVTNISGAFGFYVPIAPSLTLAVKTGAATLGGTPEFYQLNKLGGGSTLRGFMRFRFYGETAFSNQNELQYNFNMKSYLFSGKIGLLALVDNGRVWQSGETSDRWHVGTGGGIMLAPFNKIAVTATYTNSKEGNRINVRLGRLL